MIKRINKMISVLLVAVVLCLCLPTVSYASEIYTEKDSTYVLSLSLPDENGDMVVYHLTENSEIEIPIYAAKEGATRDAALDKLATLVIGESNGRLKFIFTPTSIAIDLATLGFTGEFISFFNGSQYGYNKYTVPVRTGDISKPASGTGRLSGTYTVLGYADVEILRAFVI